MSGNSAIFSNFAARLTKSRLSMDRMSGTDETSSPSVSNWGYLENWKSTAPVMARV